MRPAGWSRSSRPRTAPALPWTPSATSPTWPQRWSTPSATRTGRATVASRAASEPRRRSAGRRSPSRRWRSTVRSSRPRSQPCTTAAPSDPPTSPTSRSPPWWPTCSAPTPASTSILESAAEEFPYDLPAITTAGRYWVSGTAEVDGGQQPFRMFVKHVQSWARHPFFQFVPPEHQEDGGGGRPVAHRGARLPLRPPGPAPRRAVHATGPGRLRPRRGVQRVWLEEVPVVDREWDLGRYARAGAAGRPPRGQPPCARARGRRWATPTRSATYHDGRLSMQVLPALHDEGVWQHPLVAGAFDDELRGRLLAAADRASEYADELDAMPVRSPRHGDACPNNLLSPAGSDELRADRLRVLGAGSDRLRPRPAAGRRRPGRKSTAATTSPRWRTPSSTATSTVCGPRGATSPSRRRTTRPRAAAADLHRPVHAAVRPARAAEPTPELQQVAAAARRHRPLQPRPARLDRLALGRFFGRVVDTRDRRGTLALGVVLVEHRALVERVAPRRAPGRAARG